MVENLNTTLQILRREEHARTRKHHQERGDQIAEELRQRKLETAKRYNLSLEELDDLLSDPPRWMDFVQNFEKSQGEAKISTETSEPVSPLHGTQKKSPQSGTIFDTSDWDPGFKFGSTKREKTK